jgi:hypothetical protein
MEWLTEDAVLVCNHETGLVGIKAKHQSWVTIEGRRVLVRNDPVGCPIVGCPNSGPTIKPCTKTERVEKGYSDLVRIGGRPVCLDTVTGLTDGTPPLTVHYHVRTPGQGLVSEVT